MPCCFVFLRNGIIVSLIYVNKLKNCLKENMKQDLALSLRMEFSGPIMAHYSLKLPGSSNPTMSAFPVAGTYSWIYHERLLNPGRETDWATCYSGDHKQTTQP
ncbi:uncharacterized protein C9orf85-like isoform X3 [Gorilla gorilla gorilla]|uniref:uncharacterized protein C9orf85-like isoform X3 n=1 Tax=Gorilla gorilla gorilla TaxID=9595 RepID=UPI00300B6A97